MGGTILNSETLRIDQIRILGSVFWIAGAVTIFVASILTYEDDLKNNA